MNLKPLPRKAECELTPIPPLLLTPREAAGVLRISERLLWELTDKGEIPCLKINRLVRYAPADLQAWIDRTKLEIDENTADWLTTIGDDLADKLAAVGLIPKRGTARLGEFIEQYIAGRTDVKGLTTKALNGCKKRLLQFFDRNRNLRDITPAEADAYLIWLRENFADATAGRDTKRARQFFRAAVRAKLIRENPFEGVKGPSEVNESRKFFISRADIEAVLEACPSEEWKLIVALSRYGGLRCPSEHLALEWGNVDWDRGRFLVNSPKTGPRWVPIFPELRPYLDAAYWLAEEAGAVHVITRTRDTSKNLRTYFLRIIKKAGLQPWPKLFHNLRASRETELAALHPMHVVTAWLGHSALIAAKHYLQVTDADFERAASAGPESDAQSGAPAARQEAQQASAGVRTESHESTAKAAASEEGGRDCRGNHGGNRGSELGGGK